MTYKFSSCSLLFAILLGSGCGAPGNDDDSAFDAQVSSVTVGAFERTGGTDQDPVYEDRNVDLTYTVGANCQVWSRTSPPHGNPPEPGHEGNPHDHWNAADDSTYAESEFTWVEYGPFLTESEVIDSCSAGLDGSSPKTVNSVDYTQFQPGLYLKIKSVQ